jgi:hypothetical protein
MARLHYNALKTGSAGAGAPLSLGASLTNSATSITFNAALTYNNGTAVPTISGSDYIPLEILDASGNMTEIVWLTAYTSGATTGTITRGQEGTTGVAHSSGDKIAHGPTAANMAAGIIGYKAYNPGTLASYTTTATTATDVDATNLAVTFVAPPSGAVKVNFNALAGISSTNGQLYWGVNEGATSVIDKQVDGLNSTSVNLSLTASVVVTGLTPGSVHTYKWSWRVVTGGASPTGRMYAGDVAGQAIMDVQALP